MAPTTKMAIALFVLSLPLAGAGMLLTKQAQGMPAPHAPARRAVEGTIVGVFAVPCGRASRPLTCYRPVASYVDDATGQPAQAATRKVYRPPPHRTGDAVTVYIDTAGAAWLSVEWEARQRTPDKRQFPRVMGWMLIGCAAFGVLLSAGLTFFVDRGAIESSETRRDAAP